MNHRGRLPRLAAACLASLCALLAACASKPAGSAAGAGPHPTPASAVQPAQPASGAAPNGNPGKPAAAGGPAPAGGAAAAVPRPFAEVIKDAKSVQGLFTLWQKDDKFWLELKPADLNQPFFLSPKLKTGIGEGRFFGGLMGEELVIEFRRVHNQVQLLARNTEFTAAAQSPSGRAVDAAFSPSLLASAAVVSQPHPDRKSVLVEANALFINDMTGVAMQLQRQYRQGYALDGRNSAITAVRGEADLLVIEVLSHYASASIAMPTPGSAMPGTPQPSVPRAVPDPRSLFMTLHYSLARLPEQPMAPRKADGRLGHFTTNLSDYTDDLARTPRQRYVNRWRLEKKDPAAELSEPIKPITFWLDRSLPLKYRASVTAGVLEWNKAFEAIGFKDAIRVEVQPDDASWDTLDFGRASLRWMTNSNPAFGAIGPSHVDPRSGEILDADIGIESLSSRNLRALRSQVLASAPLMEPVPAELLARGMRSPRLCDYADQAAEQLGYALDVLEARGELDPAGPEAEQFVQGYLKDVTMHEVGHTLGLRHNFRASRIYSDAQLSDASFTASHGLTGSVMEYAAVNLSAPGVPADRQSTPFNPTLGPYDYWAIEYSYRPLSPADEASALSRIASRSSEPQLAFGTDEDHWLGIDPESLQFDLGGDVLAFARKRIDIARDLLRRQEARVLAPDVDYSVLRRSVGYAVRDMGRAATILTRQIGGVRTLRDHAGSGRDPLQPLPAAEQREALDLLARGFLSADSLRVSPALQRKLAVDYLERGDAALQGEPAIVTDYSLATQIIEMQRNVLGQLLNDAVAVRLLDSEAKSPKDALRLSELYRRIDAAVWSELGRGVDIAPARRELQREHVNRLAAQLLRPASLSRADARSLVRTQSQSLLDRMASAARQPALSAEARAHLEDSADTLRQALTAKLPRAGA